MKLQGYDANFWYKKLKPKQRKDVQQITYYNMLQNMLLSMFEWNNLPDTMPQRFIDLILMTTGTVAVGKVKDNLVCAWCTLGGNIDPYGLGSDVIATTLNGEEMRGKRNIDIAWGCNNALQTSDTLIYYISNLMAEVDTSATLNVLYSRLTKIPVVKDEKEKNAVVEILKKMIDGQFGSLISKNIFEGELEADQNYTIELTDPNKIDRIQYLSRFYDDLFKRFWNYYGQPLQTQNKTAQIQTDELHGMDSVSFILPLEMLKYRKELCTNINNIFGTNISVDFSPIWQAEYQAFLDRDGDGVEDAEDETEGEAEDETEDEAEDETNDKGGDE